MTVSASVPRVAVPAARDGAKAVLLTVLGEFVLPTGRSAWTSTLVAAADMFGIGDKNARQAIARIADQGLVASERHGRTVRWSLTDEGRELLETGARRIYTFGREWADWNEEWLVVHCPVPEAQRPLRHRLRTELAFLGCGELSPSLFVSPHVDREERVRRAVADLGVDDGAVLLRSRTGAPEADADLAARAWQLDDLATAYGDYIERHGRRRDRGVTDDADAFQALVELVHDWRRFPLADPELPSGLLPAEWVGAVAVELFHDCRSAWSPPARSWFDRVESTASEVVRGTASRVRGG